MGTLTRVRDTNGIYKSQSFAQTIQTVQIANASESFFFACNCKRLLNFICLFIHFALFTGFYWSAYCSTYNL